MDSHFPSIRTVGCIHEGGDLIAQAKNQKDNGCLPRAALCADRIYINPRDRPTFCHEKRNPALQASLWVAPQEPNLNAARKQQLSR